MISSPELLPPHELESKRAHPRRQVDNTLLSDKLQHTSMSLESCGFGVSELEGPGRFEIEVG